VPKTGNNPDNGDNPRVPAAPKGGGFYFSRYPGFLPVEDRHGLRLLCGNAPGRMFLDHLLCGNAPGMYMFLDKSLRERTGYVYVLG
jgi:hypothetical protein